MEVGPALTQQGWKGVWSQCGQMFSVKGPVDVSCLWVSAASVAAAASAKAAHSMSRWQGLCQVKQAERWVWPPQLPDLSVAPARQWRTRRVGLALLQSHAQGRGPSLWAGLATSMGQSSLPLSFPPLASLPLPPGSTSLCPALSAESVPC